MSTATAIRERPIIFSGPMVQALLEGRKTQTRRAMKKQPEFHGGRMKWCPPGARYVPAIDEWAPAHIWMADKNPGDTGAAGIVKDCPYGQPGDRLWVKERFASNRTHDGPTFVYAADGEDRWRTLGCHWHPANQMKRHASRITVEVTEVRVEQLQAISEEDAKAEGVESGHERAKFAVAAIRRAGFACDLDDSHLGKESWIQPFRQLWESIHGKGSWDLNPWVWAISFRRVES